MKLSNKEIEELMKKIVGSDVFPLVKFLKNRKNVSEIKLAEYCKKELKEIRSMLYKLHNFNFVFFVKKRYKTTGLYMYYWSLNIKRVNEIFINSKERELKKLKEDLVDEESKRFYICVNNCARLDFEKACGYNFKCPECNNLLDYERDDKKIKDILEKIENIRTTI